MAAVPVAPAGRLLALRERVLGSPEISTDGFKPYQPAVRSSFKNSAHGVINKTYSVTHLTVKQASHRYSPAAVIAVEREVMQGVPAEISTSYAERSNLSIRMSCRRFTPLTNAFSKKVENHAAACHCMSPTTICAAFTSHCAPRQPWQSASPIALVAWRSDRCRVGYSADRSRGDRAAAPEAVPGSRGRQSVVVRWRPIVGRQ
jgi:hypothetical protein